MIVFKIDENRDWELSEYGVNEPERIKMILYSFFNDYFLDTTHGLKWSNYLGESISSMQQEQLKNEIAYWLSERQIDYSNISLTEKNNEINIDIDGVFINVSNYR